MRSLAVLAVLLATPAFAAEVGLAVAGQADVTGVRIGSRDLAGAGGGVAVRGAIERLAVGGELDVEVFDKSQRIDTRLGASLLAPLTASRLFPYVLAAAGLDFVDPGRVFTTDGGVITELQRREPYVLGYVQVGAGAGFTVARGVSIELDARVSVRHGLEARTGNDVGARDDHETAGELRAATVVRF